MTLFQKKKKKKKKKDQSDAKEAVLFAYRTAIKSSPEELLQAVVSEQELTIEILGHPSENKKPFATWYHATHSRP